MKNINIYKSILLNIMLIPLVQSCIKPVEDFDIRKKDPVLVVNSVFDPDSVLKVYVTQSIGALDKEIKKYIENASVQIFSSGLIVAGLDSFKKGFYYNPGFKPLVKTRYKLIVSANGFETVESNISTVENVAITAVDTVYRTIKDEGGWENGFYEISVQFDDQADEKNFYMLETLKESYNYIYEYDSVSQNHVIVDSGFYYYNAQMVANNNQVEMSFDWGDHINTFSNTDTENDRYGMSFIFTDRLFNGKSNTFVYKIYDWYYFDPYDPILNNQAGLGKIKIQLKSISEETYLFLRSYSMYSTDPFQRFFQESVTLYSNVENGIGLVSSEAVTIDTSIQRKGYSH